MVLTYLTPMLAWLNQVVSLIHVQINLLLLPIWPLEIILISKFITRTQAQQLYIQMQLYFSAFHTWGLNMITFTKPAQLNGYQLIDELEAVGVQIKAGTRIIINAEGELSIDISEKDKLKAETVIANHVGIDKVIDNSAAKAALLDKLGITAEEAALLLG